MRIQYRYKRADSGDTVPTTAEVLQLDEQGAIQIRHETGGKKTVWLRKETWAARWEPIPDAPSQPKQVTQPEIPFPTLLSESDVRRIVREELQRAFAPQ
jgi:hypothetical protein